MATTMLATASCTEQMKHWPQDGRHILAQFDDETIIVYQAYCPSIGRFAIENGFFGGDFKYSRMSWIKPNFLWMMYRSQWGQAEGQEVVLALRLKRRFFDSLLAQAVPSSFDARVYGSQEEWTAAVARSDVRLQWDPDHLPTGDKCERRAIQIGLRGAVLEAYGKHEIVQIVDMSLFVAEQRPNVRDWNNGKLLTPVERVYIPADPNIAKKELAIVTDRVHYPPNLIFSVGTQVVTLVDIPGSAGLVFHPRGTVGVVVKAPGDLEHAYRVRFPDGFEAPLKRTEITMLARFKEGEINENTLEAQADLYERVIYRCVIGSQAYGLAGADSDVDRRGVFLPSADVHWSLYGVPEQLKNDATQEAYWELQKFLVMALKANPNVLECLYTPLVEKATPLAQELLGMKSIFLSRMVYQTYNGYVLSQFKKMQADIRNHGQVKWKHVMHLIRLLLSGIGVLRDGM